MADRQKNKLYILLLFSNILGPSIAPDQVQLFVLFPKSF